MRVVTVTGASAGVGRAIAKAFAKRGDKVALIARSHNALIDLVQEIESEGGMAMALPCDVSDAAAVAEAAELTEQTLGPIDIWVNCAMVTVFSPITDLKPQELARVTDVTYHGAVYGSMCALKYMRDRNRGHIIQIGSALAYRSIPLQSAYCGAKHALKGFTASLQAELIHQKSNIDVSMVHLPAFNTPQFLWARNHTDNKAQPVPPIHQPALAAEAVLWTSDNPQREVWVGLPTWKAILGHKFFPGFMDRYVAKNAWEAQFAGKIEKKHTSKQSNNLYKPLEGLHREQGPFDESAIAKKPFLWHVRNQNFWINGLAIYLFIAVFILGLVIGAQ